MTDRQDIVLEGVEAQLLEVALLERKRAVEEADATFMQRMRPIRLSHKIEDGIRVQFSLDDGQALMRVG